MTARRLCGASCDISFNY